MSTFVEKCLIQRSHFHQWLFLWVEQTELTLCSFNDITEFNYVQLHDPSRECNSIFFFLDKNMAKLNQGEMNDPSDVQPASRHEDGYTNI